MTVQIPRTISVWEAEQVPREQREGYVRKKSGSWLGSYRVPTTEIDPKTLKPKKQKVTVKLGPLSIGKRKARSILKDDYLSKVAVQVIRPGSSKTLGEFWKTTYLPGIVPTHKRSWAETVQSVWTLHIQPALGEMPLREINATILQSLINLKSKETSKKTGKPLTKTCKHILDIVSAMMNEATDAGWIEEPPRLRRVRLPEMPRQQTKALGWVDVLRLSTVLSEPCATLVLFLALTGLRIGEAMGLKWENLNLTASPVWNGTEMLPPYSLVVRQAFVRGRYQTVKSKKSTRPIPIPEDLARRLAAFSRTQNKSAAREELKSSPVAPVFANGSLSAPLDQNSLQRWSLKPVAAAIGWGTPGVKGIRGKGKGKRPQSWVSWHTFRRSYATLTDQLGLTMAERMSLMGHASAAMTTHYTLPEFERIREKLQGLPKLVQ